MSTIVSILPKWRFDASEVEIPENWDIRFLTPKTADEIVAACQDASYLLAPASCPALTAASLEKLAHLKLIQIIGAGYDRIDILAAQKLGIPVANVPGQNATTVAEFTVGLMIALQRQLPLSDREIKAGRYSAVRQTLFSTGLHEIAGSKIGLVGLGAIGQHTARILNCLGASVSYYNRSRKAPAEEALLNLTFISLDELLADSDIVSLHVPLTAQTKGLIGRRELALMAPGSLLINTARGDVVDQVALAEALENGQLAGAAIDTFSPEPPDSEHPLLRLSPAASERLLLTPHSAGVTVTSFRKMLCGALDNLARVLRGDSPNHVVNGPS